MPLSHRQRLFLIDDQPLFRHGMAQVINSEADLTVCGEVADAARAAIALKTLPADLLLLNVTAAHEAGGLELLHNLRRARNAARVLALSAEFDPQSVLTVLRAGAQGYLIKTEGLHDFVAAIRRVLGGQLYVHPSISEQILASLAAGEPAARTPQALERLSAREKEVLRLIGRGWGNRQIAEALALSPRTVESHRLHIREKLGLNGPAELVHFAVVWMEEEGGALARG